MRNQKSAVDNSHQIILLDDFAKVRYSCESLISLKLFKEVSLLEDSPFLESIYPELLIRQTTDKALRYNRMENPFPGLPGTYDFSFKWVEIHDGRFILWNIYDLSDMYSSIKKIQQVRNEQAMLSEHMAQISKAELRKWDLSRNE